MGTSVPVTPQVKLPSPNNNEVVKRTGPLDTLQHSFGSAFSSSNNSAFEPSKNPSTKSHSHENSLSPTTDSLHGFRFIDEKTEPKESLDEDAQVAASMMHCVMEGMDVRQNNTPVAMPATTRPRSSSRSTSPATTTSEYTTYSNRHRHHRRSS